MIRRDGLIVQKTLSFSIAIIKFCTHLSDKRQFVISNQLMKSGTSIGANVFEAQYAESRFDFIHKMKIAQKEANESLYWILICETLEESAEQKELMIIANEF